QSSDAGELALAVGHEHGTDRDRVTGNHRVQTAHCRPGKVHVDRDPREVRGCIRIPGQTRHTGQELIQQSRERICLLTGAHAFAYDIELFVDVFERVTALAHVHTKAHT